jgi:Barstar (barnase inhibitor)
MTVFRVDDDNDLDFVVLRDGGISLYRNCQCLREDVQWLRHKGYRIYSVDCSAWVSEDAMHESLLVELSFPAYYGKNLDALNDCISDLDVPDDGGVAIVLTSYDVYAADPGSARMQSGTRQAEQS